MHGCCCCIDVWFAGCLWRLVVNGGTTRNMYSHGSSANGWFVRKLVVARAVVCMQCCVVLCPTKKVLLFMNTCPRKRALVPCNDRNRRIGAQTLVWYPSVGTGTSTYQLQDYVPDGKISSCLNVCPWYTLQWFCVRVLFGAGTHVSFLISARAFRAGAPPTGICWWRRSHKIEPLETRLLVGVT